MTKTFGHPRLVFLTISRRNNYHYHFFVTKKPLRKNGNTKPLKYGSGGVSFAKGNNCNFLSFLGGKCYICGKEKKNGTQKNFSGYHFFPSGGDAL